MEEQEVQFSEREMEELKKTIKVLEDRTDELMTVKLPASTDKYAIDFVKSVRPDEIEFLTTKEVFDKYLTYRRRYTTNGEALLSVRMLNAVIRKYFPDANIKHSNKNNKNSYFWVFYQD